jgi:site-specific DNA-methyltransferase (adenine-specific)
MSSIVFNEDCMAVMQRYADKHFDLAVVDPPYGIGEDGKSNHSRGKIAKSKLYTSKQWDNEPPSIEYFTELLRVSKNQIVWGSNHFISRLSIDSSCWIVWDKDNGETDFADCELAWTSFKTAVRRFKFKWQGMLQGNMKDKEIRIHPTQKPVALYDWIFKNYATQGQTILDTHLGSGSSRIAANKAGLSFVGCELDKDYFEAQEKRFKDYKSQLTIF